MWPFSSSASDQFAARAVELNRLAAIALDAKARGDAAGLEAAMRAYSTAAGQVDPQPLIEAAKRAESPSALAVTLDSFSDTVLSGAKWATIALVGLIVIWLYLTFVRKRS